MIIVAILVLDYAKLQVLANTIQEQSVVIDSGYETFVRCLDGLFSLSTLE